MLSRLTPRRRPWIMALGIPLVGAGLLLAAVAIRPSVGGAGPAAPTSPDAAGGQPAPAEPPSTSMVLVFVSGAVAHPGMYRLGPGARVGDAVAASGGMTPNADAGHLPNLAARVRDGTQVNVPVAGSRANPGGGRPRVDINSASLEELRAIPGMPATLPEAIVDLRTRWGRIGSLIDLRRTLGLDRVTASGLGRYLRYGPG